VRTFALATVPVFVFTLLKDSLFYVVQPLLFAQLIQFFADPKSHNYLHACLYAAGVVGSNCLSTAINHPVMLLTLNMGIQARVAWVTLIYRKVGLPRLSAAHSVGLVVDSSPEHDRL